MNTSRKQVPESQRLAITEMLFGAGFPMRLEPLIYHIADTIAEDYHGGYWEFQELSNGGFYMAPDSEALFHVCCDNGFEGELSADALGITVCLYAYSMLSFGKGSLAETCARQFHLLRDYMLGHPESGGILRAID